MQPCVVTTCSMWRGFNEVFVSPVTPILPLTWALFAWTLLKRDWLSSEQWNCHFRTPVIHKDDVHQDCPCMHIHWWPPGIVDLVHVEAPSCEFCECINVQGKLPWRIYLMHRSASDDNITARTRIENGDTDMLPSQSSVKCFNKMETEHAIIWCARLKRMPWKIFQNILLCQEMSLWPTQLLQSIHCIPLSSLDNCNIFLCGNLRVGWRNDLLYVFTTSTTVPAFPTSKKADLKS